VTAVVVAPDAGRVLRTPAGAEVIVKIASSTLTVFEISSDAGAPHRHAAIDEVFFVIAGRYSFELDDASYEAPAGSVVLVPRGTRHRFRMLAPGRILSVTTPGGIDRLFTAVAS